MDIILTSSFIRYQDRGEYKPEPLLETNGFADNLRLLWPQKASLLLFACDPEDYDGNDHVRTEIVNAFSLAGFIPEKVTLFDNRMIGDRNPKECLREALTDANVLYVSGGHGPTEHAFIVRTGLRELLQKKDIFDGLYIGLSAGSVNAADTVYMPPELPGESLDVNFVKTLRGLGLTNINMIPHCQHLETVVLDGRPLLRDIIAADSCGRKLYAVLDGSYFVIRNGVTEFFGEGFIMQDGKFEELKQGIVHVDDALLGTLASDYYELVAELDAEEGKLRFLYIGERLAEAGINSVNADYFGELNRMLSERLVVQDEKEAFLDQIALDYVSREVSEKGCYVRTVHFDCEDTVFAQNIRIGRITGSENRYLVTMTDISSVLDHDWMTDEYSESGFLMRAAQLLRDPAYAEGYSIVYSNVQGLKAVNNMLGTYSGDMVIFMERDILVRELKPVLIGRVESDHFALMVKTEHLTERRLKRMCRQVYVEGPKRLPLQYRCGIYTITDLTLSVRTMLDRAQLAEKSIADAKGIPYAFCDDKMSSDYVLERELVTEMDAALAEGQFRPYFQPIVSAGSGEIVGAEALVRWIHPTRGMISPGVFIPIFEKKGLISKLDSFMLDSVIRINRKRLMLGERAVPCAVNLSRVDFFDTGLLAVFKQRIGAEESIGEMLKLEITESAYETLETNALAFLEEIKQHKISLLLDDFGSGMSSLSMLETFDFDIIKLDMGFVAKIGKSSKVEAIIRHTIGLAHDIGAMVVAEGVETEEQVRFLKDAGVDMIQGYYFYRPMPEEDFAELLR